MILSRVLDQQVPGNLNELVKTISLLGKSHISFPMKNLIIKVAT